MIAADDTTRGGGSVGRHGRWAAAVLVCVFLLAAGPSTAGAQTSSQETADGRQGADFDPESPSWNGLANLVALSSQLGAGLEASTTLDYGSLSTERPLVIVYPGQALNVTSLAEFVIDGGRVLMADDFGASGSFLERLDIERSMPPMQALPHGQFAEGRPGVPVFEPDGVHPLLEGVDRVLANHPAVLRHSGGPVVGYDRSGGLVYDMNLGEGKVIVFGDASLLINQMLKAGDNQQLVKNALRYLCEGKGPECAPGLYVGAFEQKGRYRGEGDGQEEQGGLAWLFQRVNRTLAGVQEDIGDSQLPYYLSILLAAGLIFYLTAVFSVSQPRPYSRYIAEAVEDVPAPQSEFEWNISRFGADRRNTNYALPLSILKEVFEEMFLRELDAWERRPADRPAVVELAGRFSEKYLKDRPPDEQQEIEREVEQLLSTFARIPTRHRVFLDSDAYFSDRDLVQLYRRTMRVLEIMGLEEEYERRTGTLV